MTISAVPLPVPTASPSAVPEALHVSEPEVPWAEDWGGEGSGMRLKLLMADIEGAVFTVRLQMQPGTQLPPHMHTGAVHAFTHAGEWCYLEYPDSPPSRAGSYLYEPAGSTHTLKVSDTCPEVMDATFTVHGAMIHYAEDGSVAAVGDAATHLRDYFAALRAQGSALPKLIRGGTSGYTDEA
ncbi:2,4'-dihydroxyacetophenone dioxygenase family protein [Streptomyces violarus]|uniref:2,4'-dihydroxyacetophenone dioxygenase family protein n=1 Tax=Streptomyces violarus TaxID=67380 RepID=UPI0021C12CDF|nr:2,4'-dihydroxyacetophenone dioxygenase family protein [Streptomyces violarus]MCT9137624.1 2,4'-dihydroxyacetophenone dioxygenase family protein [Streptomyces violarus]